MTCRKTSQVPTIHKTSQKALLINTSNREAALIKTERKLEILQQMCGKCLLHVYLLSIAAGLKQNRRRRKEGLKCFHQKCMSCCRLQHNAVLLKVFKALNVLTPPYIPDCLSFSVPSRTPLGPRQLAF